MVTNDLLPSIRPGSFVEESMLVRETVRANEGSLLEKIIKLGYSALNDLAT